MKKRRKNKSNHSHYQFNLPPEFLAHLSKIGKRGGQANTPAQRKHRRTEAVRAMLNAKFPNEPRWWPKKAS
jgi:hypothetical protein